ncbi:MAG: hypothetical protein HXY23_01505 [Parvularculaceae bacterium]|nr:hypothetical protein [Parvularculaceae bacterium]
MKTIGLIGGISPESTAIHRRRLERPRPPGAEGVRLGCTELSLLIGLDDVAVPFLDPTRLHAASASAFAFS